MPLSPDRRRQLALDVHHAAVAAADPAPAVEAALREHGLPEGRTWVVAIGKAAPAMAESAIRALAGRGRVPAGGLVVSPAVASTPHPALTAVQGDHPLPAARSAAAARLLADVVAGVAADDRVLVLLSGGATALVGAPVAEVEPWELARLYDLLLRSGAPIEVMNAFRKRFSRWGAGRLAAALAPAAVHCLAVSDVAGDDVATIGSGPTVPDPVHAADLLRLVEEPALRAAVSPALRRHLELVAGGQVPETPKPGDPALAHATTRVILSNRDALRAAAARARALGLEPVVVEGELDGEAAEAGRRCAERLLALAGERAAARDAAPPAVCLLWGGETTVTLPLEGDGGAGGRCQELALAAAERLAVAERAGAPRATTLLAAGTDGRDGPTDAAGAVVDGGTWAAIRAAGLDPARLLAAHDSHRALDRAGALVRTGPTGTNVRDVVVGIVG